MNLRSILAVLLLCLLASCSGKDDNNAPTAPAAPSYSMSDVEGTWKGTAVNSSNTLNLTLTVNSQCKVSGSGVSCTWTIDDAGKVTGSGSFSFVSGSYLTVASSSWSLQMSNDKRSMTGSMDVSYSTLHGMSVSVTKQ